ncbi:MAG: penicillin acylase family protein, partial [Saprospiraceae bacterium]
HDAFSEKEQQFDIGSNNWVVDGSHTQSGYPMMANDPHRRQSAPSLRYMAHLVAPGWNVIGGGEPELPGISIGHNEYGAWGLTVFRTDAEDLYVYETNPENPNQYWYRGAWENMRIITDTIPVKGKAPVVVELKYTRHGPVTFEDTVRHRACAMRCGWLETGGSPYLASLRMDQSRTWEEFREACSYSNIPGENMVWADRAGNIGWQAVGIAPIRPNWSGLVPVPGDGSYEWDGYLPIKAKPHVFNPPGGIFYTANANVTPRDYPYMDAIGFSWSDPYREDRVAELLGSSRKHSLMDMANYQTDYLSIPARQLVPLLHGLTANDPAVEKARQMLLRWDFNMTPESVEAGIYNTWERQLLQKMKELVVPEKARPYASVQMKKVVGWLVLPDGKFGENPTAGRDDFLIKCLKDAVTSLTRKLGKDMRRWQYGQPAYKHVVLKHLLSDVVPDSIRAILDVGPAPRGGNSYTPNATGGNDNQTHGASFRLIVDTGDWDACLGTNTPGQSGNPDSPHYRNLFALWAKDRYFPVFFSKNKVESVAEERTWLVPK